MTNTVRLIGAANAVNYWLEDVHGPVLTFTNTETKRGFDLDFAPDAIVIREFDLSTNKLVLSHEVPDIDHAIKLIATF